MRVESLSSALETEYRDFLLRDSRNLIYASLEFRDFLVRAVGGVPTYLLALEDSGQIAGVLPYFELEAPGIGTVINSLPWYGSHGGCLVAGPAFAEARRLLLERYRSATEAPGIVSATLILSPHEEEFVTDYKEILHHSVEDNRIGQMTPLPPDSATVEAELESILLQKTRNLVRKARKQGFVLRESDDYDAWKFLFDTHVENLQAIGGKSKPWAHFVAMREALPGSARRLFLAELDGVPVAAVLMFYFNRTVEYVTPVIKHEYRSMQPLSFLIWNAMLEAIRAGYRWWNWGGTWVTQTSLHHFKAGWGALDCPYRYCIVVSESGLSALRRDRHQMATAFPFYYVFPFDQL